VGADAGGLIGTHGEMKTLDIERPAELLEYLRATGRIGPRERVNIRRLSGGISNRTMLVERESGEAWVLKQALDRLRVEVEWLSDPERVHREALGMRWLARLTSGGVVPELLFEDRQHHLLAMQAIPRPHENWKELLLAGRLDASLVEQFGRLLGTIHRRSWERRDELAGAFGDRAIFESLRIEPYFRYAATQLPAAGSFLEGVIESVQGRRLALVHGDYSPKNLLVWKGKLVLVDHETIHFGDPAFDVGFSLTHLLSKANHLAHLREEFAAAARAHWRAYRDALGEELPWAGDLEIHAVRLTIACLIARVVGRSRLEYLDEGSRSRQLESACQAAADPPARVDEFIGAFVARL
jgi:5-methylthioribose kinase